MKFSVVVCVKNEEKRILQCLRSIKKNKTNEIIDNLVLINARIN
jgi:glycosyltransferase involved in cell wall biosynthesis